ncbi:MULTISPECIES: hypothetical protein [unclassified Flavobacterium]|uniref:hypothetical protein n=1 Tax=unclassified Flavobacterium TaxID=196869 RepID=UPI003F9037B5
MNQEKLSIKELNYEELQDTNGGFVIEALTLACAVIGGIYYLGKQCAEYDQRHGY